MSTTYYSTSYAGGFGPPPSPLASWWRSLGITNAQALSALAMIAFVCMFASFVFLTASYQKTGVDREMRLDREMRRRVQDLAYAGKGRHELRVNVHWEQCPGDEVCDYGNVTVTGEVAAGDTLRYLIAEGTFVGSAPPLALRDVAGVDPTSPLSGCLCIERAPALPNSEEDGPFAVPYALNGSAAVELSSALGAPGGIAAFDANGLVRSDQLPAPAGANETVLVFMGVFNATSDSAGLSNETACTPGEYYIVSSGGNLTLGTYPVVASEWQTGDSLVCMHHCNNTSGGGNSSVGIANCTAAERFASWTRIPNPYKHPPPRIYKAHWYMEEAAPSSSSAGAVLPARYAVHGSWLWATSLGQSPAYAQRTLTLPSAQDVLLQNPYKRRGDYIELDALFAVEDAAASVCLAMGEGLAFTGAHSPPFDASLCVHGPSAMWHVRLRLTIAANPSSQTGLRIVVQPILALPVSSSPWHARA